MTKAIPKISTKGSFKSSLSLLRVYVVPQWGKGSLLLGLLFVSLVLEVLNPQVVGRFVDSVHGGVGTLVRLAVLFLGVVIANQLVTAFAGYLSEDIGWGAMNALRVDLALHCLNLDMSFHKLHTPGELLERVDGDVAQLADFFSRFVFAVLARVLLLLGIVGLTFFIDWRFGLLLLAFTLVMGALMHPLQGIAIPHFRAARQASADMSSFLEERLAAREDMLSLGAQSYVLRRFSELARALLRATRLSGVTGQLFSSSIEIVLALGVAALLTLGAYLLRAGQVSLGTIYATYAYTALLTQSLYVITYEVDRLQAALASLQRLTELLHTSGRIVDGPAISSALSLGGEGAEAGARPPRRITQASYPYVGERAEEGDGGNGLGREGWIVDGSGGPLSPGPLAVRFTNASFAYTAEKPVLRNVSFDLPAGKVLGVLGRTGSGKTTLSRLLARLYDAQEGAVELGEIDVRLLPLAELRERIGVVTQDVQLFHASLRDNLTFFDPSIPDERLEETLAALNLSSWYAALPDGLDTPISGGGMTLSAGEAQLLAFARVFLRDPAVVILDEASSRLDPLTEQLIEGAIARLLAGRTGIVIAHHLATVQHVDDILILENGAIREYGARKALAADPNSRFSHLLKTTLAEVLS